MAVEIYSCMRIQSHPAYYYTVEDFDIDIGYLGITISGFEIDPIAPDRRHSYLTVSSPEEARAIATALVEMADSLEKKLDN